MLSTTTLRHVRVELALHCLREGGGRPLLLLHGLGEETPAQVPAIAVGWPGPVWGLDFTGHGASTVPQGGGYTPEALMSDADAAIAELGPVTVLGRGVGGYAGLLLAGSRPRDVRGLIIVDGPGLEGGGAEPPSSNIPGLRADARVGTAPDSWALLELSTDIRPVTYAAEHVQQIAALSGLAPAVCVDAIGRPAWLRAALEHDVVAEQPATDAIRLFGETELGA